MDSIIIRNDPNDTNYFYFRPMHAFIKKDQTFYLAIDDDDDEIIIKDWKKFKDILIDNLPDNFVLIIYIYKWQMVKFDIIKQLFYKYNMKELRTDISTKYFYLEKRLWNTKCAIK